MILVSQFAETTSIYTSIFSGFISLIVCFISVSYNNSIANNNRRLTKENVNQQLSENRINNNKALNANVLSNARIEWLQKARENTAELVSNFFSITESFPSIGSKISKQETKEISASFSKFFTSVYLLKIFYNVKDKNNNINEDHEALHEKLNALDQSVDQFQKNYFIHIVNVDGNVPIDFNERMSDLHKLLEELIEESSRYFKQVWEEAKNFEDN